MAPVLEYPSTLEETPMSRTHQYRKVMKPLLERKRRARINKCLDDLKDLMVEAVQAEGESINKLEKADVLELTVNHLRKLRRQQMLRSNPALDMDRYNAGYTAAAAEVSRFLSSVPGIDIKFGTGLMAHLGSKVSALNSPLSVNTLPAHRLSSYDLPLSPSSDGGYNSGRESVSPPLSVGSPSPAPFIKSESVWRPF